MSEVNTTSINELPTDPSVGGNINLSIKENKSQNEESSSSQLSLDQNTISQIVNGLQEATLSGATQLASRDIPLITEQLTKDVEITPNYVPPPDKKDYITEYDDDINQYYNKEKQQGSFDSLYEEIHTPLLLAVLYFLFQLPFFKKNIFNYFPFFCNTDGNYNFNGLIFSCLLFGFIFYSLSKTVKNFSRF